MANLRSALWPRGAERGEIIRVMRKSDRRGWLSIPRFGSAALACALSALLWTLVLAPAADADSTPKLTDGSTGSTMTTVVGSTVNLTPGVYTDDPGSLAVQDNWYDCSSQSPPQTAIEAAPIGCSSITPTSTSYVVQPGDLSDYITVFETDPVADALTLQTNQVASNTLQVLPAPPTNKVPPSIAGATTSGSTLSAVPGLWTGSGNNYSYSWERCNVEFSICTEQSTTATYQLTSDDVNHYVLLRQTASNPGGSLTITSSPFGPISTPTPTLPAPTETTLQITPAGVVAGQPTTLIATVTSATGQAPPMGAITFEQAGTAIPGCASITTHPAGASATVTCQATFAGSSSTLSAVFTPAPGSQVTGSDSTAVGFVLGRAATAAMVILPRRVTLGKRLTMTAKVAPQAGTRGVSPTGAVVFLDGKKAIKGCSSTLAKGVAHCTVTYKALGTHSISAVYLGDVNFSGSSTHVHTLAVVVAKPTGFVTSLMTWTFNFKPRYTRVTTLAVTGVQPGLTISVDCSGSGCPKHRYVDTVTRAACGKRDTCKNVNLAKRLDGRKLGVGATLTVRLTHPGWLGKYYSFLVRQGRKPKIDTACLAVGQAKPGAGCTPQ
jgi:Bacterial Ig-like domain (group 3)